MIRNTRTTEKKGKLRILSRFVSNHPFMSSYFKDTVVAVTGGTEGIGKALVAALVEQGARVSTCGRNHDKLYRLQAEFPSAFLHTTVTDVSKENECRRFIESTVKAFGGIDILINNAGISMRALIKEADTEVIRKVMDINFLGTVYCTSRALPSVIRRKGSIVAISSIAGYRGLPGRSGYSASKFALNGWMESLRTELLDSGVNVTWVSPGYTRSNIRQVALNEKAEAQGESPLDEGQLMSAEKCAERILDAVAKRKRTLVMTAQGQRAVWINKLFPAWADRLTHRFFFRDGKLIK